MALMIGLYMMAEDIVRERCVLLLFGCRIGEMLMVVFSFCCGYGQLLYCSTLMKTILEVVGVDVRQSLNKGRNTMNKTTVLDIHVSITDV